MARAKRSKTRIPLVSEEVRKKVLFDEYETTIMYGMARYLWVEALMRWLDPASGGTPIRRWPSPVRDVDAFARFYDVLDLVTHDGETWDDASPLTPGAAYKAALDLARLLALTSHVGNTVHAVTPPVQYFANHPMTQLFMMAMDLHLHAGYNLVEPKYKGPGHFHGKEFPDIHTINLEYDDQGARPVTGIYLAYRFGSGIAAEAIQAGYRETTKGPLVAIGAWYDDHKGRGSLEIPSFKVRFDGHQLSWEGGSSRGHELA